MNKVSEGRVYNKKVLGGYNTTTYSENHTKPMNTLCRKMQSSLILKQMVYILQ